MSARDARKAARQEAQVERLERTVAALKAIYASRTHLELEAAKAALRIASERPRGEGQ